MTLTLYPYQSEGVAWMRSRLRGLLADEPGLGKTIQVLMAIDGRYGAVIVCPAFLKENWEDEAGVWRWNRAEHWARELKDHRPDLTPVVLKGRDSFRWPRAGEVVVTNYDILPVSKSRVNGWLRELKEEAPKVGLKLYRGALIDDPSPGAMASLFSDAIRAEKRASLERIIERRAAALARRREIGRAPRGVELYADEAQAVTNWKTERTKSLRELVKEVIAAEGRSFALTGTPLMDRAPQLWGLLVTFQLHKEAFGDRSEFERIFDARQGKYAQEWGTNVIVSDAVPALKRVMKRRLKRLVLDDLPDKVYQRTRVEIDKSELAECEAFVEMLAERGIDLATATDEALEQACEKLGFAELSRAKHALALAKVPASKLILQTYVDAGVPVAFMSDHVAPAEAIAAHFGWPLITGKVATDKRQGIAKAFQAGGSPGIALSIGAAGVGLTLHRAAIVVRNDRNWTPAKNEQGVDRFHRIGQRSVVHVNDVIADHVMDQRLSEIELRKTALMAVVDAAAEGVTQ